MKKRIKKTAVFMILFGLVLTSVALYFGLQSFELILSKEISLTSNENIGIFITLLSGLLFLILGIVWFFWHRRDFGNIGRLKHHGKKIHARYIDQEKTKHTIEKNTGIVFLMKEEGGERIFQTQPIFSEYSVKWIEEHLFDVYIDPKNPDNYYIDMEKHFGIPQKHI